MWYLPQHPGADPQQRRRAHVIHYLETPPSRDQLVALIAAMDMPVRDLLRKNVPPYEALGWRKIVSAMMN